MAEETEEAVAEAQPGVVVGMDGSVVEGVEASEGRQPTLSDETGKDGANSQVSEARPGAPEAGEWEWC
jgi:hypothetical protein